MADGSLVAGSPKLRYAARAERARDNRRRVVEAAHRLIVDNGYLATTMSDIAAEAAVAVQTLYLGFGSKVGILSKVLDRAVAGDDAPVAVLERPWVGELLREPDPRRAVELFAHEARLLVERSAPIYRRAQEAAADADVAHFLDHQRDQRYETLRALAGILVAKAGIRASTSADRVADILYALVGEDSYRLLCMERGWSADAWEQLITEALTGLCLSEPRVARPK
jgi:AcrR family transcriptional regulator